MGKEEPDVRPLATIDITFTNVNGDIVPPSLIVHTKQPNAAYKVVAFVTVNTAPAQSIPAEMVNGTNGKVWTINVPGNTNDTLHITVVALRHPSSDPRDQMDYGSHTRLGLRRGA